MTRLRQSPRVRPPRQSSAAAAVTEFALTEPPLPAPPELTEAQRADWNALVASNPARFTAGDGPLLREFVRHTARSRVIAAALAELEGKSLTGTGKGADKTRSIYLQLASAAREESKLVASLSVKLRLAVQTKTRKSTHESAERERPSGPRPWDRNNSDRQGDDFN